MELVHETWKIKGWNIVGSIDWMEIGDETGLPFEDHPGELHYINGCFFIKLQATKQLFDEAMLDLDQLKMY